MSVIINASTTSGLVMSSDLSGQLQFQNNGVNLPMGGVAPAFSAYAGTATSCSSAAFTKILFDTEEFDTNNNFASSTFTPTVAGYYQINACVSMSSAGTALLIVIYKNNAEYKRGAFANITALNNVNVSSIVYFNGTTDNVDIRIYQNSGIAINTGTGIASVWVNGCLVRGA